MSEIIAEAAEAAKPIAVRRMSDGSSPTGSSYEFDGGKEYMGDKSYATPMNTGMYSFVKPGQIALGTTIYNPQPSDIEQERIFGERKYNEKPNPESPVVMRQRVNDQAAALESQAVEIESLKGMMAAFIAAQSSAKPAAVEAAPVDAYSDEVPPDAEPVESAQEAKQSPKRKPRTSTRRKR